MKKKLLACLLSIFGLSVFYYYKSIIEDERDFATFGLVREKAIYTLLGSKPLSEFGYRGKPRNRSVTPEEVGLKRVKVDRSKLNYTKENCFKKDPVDMWRRWKKRHSTSGKNISLILVDRKCVEQIYLVNKSALKKTLNKYYKVIVNAIQEEFDVDKVLEDMDDPNSFFWQKIINPKQSRIQIGLCFGYGLENAEYFERSIRTYGFKHAFASNNDKCIEEELNLLFRKKVTIQDLLIPFFRTFKNPDPVAERYKKERTRIQEQYKDADLRQLLIDALKQ